jgi:hypothetical protein
VALRTAELYSLEIFACERYNSSGLSNLEILLALRDSATETIIAPIQRKEEKNKEVNIEGNVDCIRVTFKNKKRHRERETPDRMTTSSTQQPQQQQRLILGNGECSSSSTRTKQLQTLVVRYSGSDCDGGRMKTFRKAIRVHEDLPGAVTRNPNRFGIGSAATKLWSEDEVRLDYILVCVLFVPCWLFVSVCLLAWDVSLLLSGAPPILTDGKFSHLLSSLRRLSCIDT